MFFLFFFSNTWTYLTQSEKSELTYKQLSYYYGKTKHQRWLDCHIRINYMVISTDVFCYSRENGPKGFQSKTWMIQTILLHFFFFLQNYHFLSETFWETETFSWTPTVNGDGQRSGRVVWAKCIIIRHAAVKPFHVGLYAISGQEQTVLFKGYLKVAPRAIVMSPVIPVRLQAIPSLWELRKRDVRVKNWVVVACLVSI